MFYGTASRTVVAGITRIRQCNLRCKVTGYRIVSIGRGGRSAMAGDTVRCGEGEHPIRMARVASRAAVVYAGQRGPMAIHVLAGDAAISRDVGGMAHGNL